MLPTYPPNSFVTPQQQKPLNKILNRMLKPKILRHSRLPKRMKKKHQVKFY